MAGEYLTPTPYANPLTGLSNDMIQGLLNYMKDKQRTQQMQGLAGLLESTGIPKTVERAAYADSPKALLDTLTNVNRANVPLLKPETADAIMNVAPLVGPAARVAERGAMAAGRAGERVAEKYVPQIMESGGLPAQLLGDLSQGSVRKMYVPATQQEAFEAAKLLRNNTPQEVWAKTGVAKYGDDFVKEISDKDAIVGFTHLEGVNNGDRIRELAFDNPELYALMPELKKFGQLGLREDRMRGSFQGVGDTGSLLGYAPNEKDLKTVMAHEMQHGVQNLQGWERGGSAKDIAIDLAENKLKAEEVMTKLEKMQNKASDEARRANPELVAKAKKWADETGSVPYKDADDKMIVKEYVLQTDPVYASLYQNYADLAYNKPALLGAEETYNRLAGEAQARSTQNRVDLTDAQRRQYFPFELKSEANPYGLDVAPEDLLYRSQMGENALRSNPKAAMEGLLETAEPKATSTPIFETGKEVTFPFIKNTEKAPKVTGMGQDIEPSGNYISSGHDVDLTKLPKNYTSGEMSFKNPLVIDWGKGLYSDPDNWKNVLSEQYGGKTGKALSKAIANEGYDGIVTMDKYGPSEIVDLSMFKKKRSLLD